jgi:NAD(P)-dependent dehydrogenase (short-subunit alcohol dehydrogenase family)
MGTMTRALGVSAVNNVGVVITGGGTGIGFAIARHFVEAGHPIYVISREARASNDELRAIAKANGGEEPRHLAANVTQREQLHAARQEIEDTGQPIGVVVASAGINIREPALEVSDAAVHRMIDTNLYGVIATFQEFAPLALQVPSSRFIAVGSVSGQYGMNLRATYGATKAAISGLVRSLSVEWARRGATVNAVAPGIIDTALTRGYMEKYPEREQAVIANTLVGRLGTVEDVAHAVAFLASEDSGFITGQTLTVDGGLSAGCSWW